MGGFLSLCCVWRGVSGGRVFIPVLCGGVWWEGFYPCVVCGEGVVSWEGFYPCVVCGGCLVGGFLSLCCVWVSGGRVFILVLCVWVSGGRVFIIIIMMMMSVFLELFSV